MIKKIEHNGIVLAIVILRDYSAEGIKFLTPDEYSQQLGYMKRPAGYIIPPHVHNRVPRQVDFTNEVLYVKRGKVRVDFYLDEMSYLKSMILGGGDVILLASGGHGFEILEESEIIEVKQGPYGGEMDKTRFSPISSEKVIFD